MVRLFRTGFVWVVGIGLPIWGLVSSSSEGREKTPSRTLTLTERVAFQRAIEEVCWRHRIWPKENPGPKPSLDAIISRRQIKQKVEDYLRKSQLVPARRGLPITATELQAEMDRIAQHTKRPEMLREFFEALGNDPFVIAECLARPILAERLAAGPSVVTGVSPAPTTLSRADTGTANSHDAQYKLPEVALLDCTDDAWTATSTTDAPDGRIDYTGVWTGSEMIVWGGYSNGDDLNSGARYNPAADTWTPTTATDAPIARESHTAVWTGTEMIVWGGLGCGSNCRLNSGSRYNPNTDTWTPSSTTNAPEARWAHNAEWTGSEMIVWGGTDQTIYLNTGAKYNPSDDSWMPTSTANAPLGRIAHTAVWSGSEMIVWGGVDETFNDTNTGGRYNPIDDSWAATSLNNAPTPRDSQAAVWSGGEMVVWGGVFCCPAIDFDTGGRYNTATDSWTATSTENAPLARWGHTAVWTGTEMIAWGGFNDPDNLYLNTGGRYCAQAPPTPTPTPTAAASPTPTTTPTTTPSATPRISPTPRIRPTPRPRPTQQPHPLDFIDEQKAHGSIRFL